LIQGLDHIGIAVRNLDEAIGTYRSILGLGAPHREEIPERKMEIAFFGVGGVKLELISPTGTESAVHSFLAKRGEGLHHLAFKTDDIDKAARALLDKSFTLAQRPTDGAHGTRVLFLHPKDSHGVLIELVQEE
jgi:methylmalonyl-CoA/ethylmalonyl-CoA epimerase